MTTHLTLSDKYQFKKDTLLSERKMNQPKEIQTALKKKGRKKKFFLLKTF